MPLIYRKDFIADEVRCTRSHQAPHTPTSRPFKPITSAKPLLCRSRGAKGPLGTRSSGHSGEQGHWAEQGKGEEHRGGMHHAHFPRVGRAMGLPLRQVHLPRVNAHNQAMCKYRLIPLLKRRNWDSDQSDLPETVWAIWSPGLGLSIPGLSQKYLYPKKPRGCSIPYLLGTSQVLY